MMHDAVIVSAVRTPIGKRNGSLSGVYPADLSAHVLESLVAATGIDPATVDDVIWGCVTQVGEQTFDIARTAVLSAGWQYDVIVAGGVESMSRIPMGSAASTGGYPLGQRYIGRYGEEFPSQDIGADIIADAGREHPPRAADDVRGRRAGQCDDPKAALARDDGH
jgi:acetyl-CoA acyltransferase